MSVNYPSDFPFSEVYSVTAIIRNGEVAAKRKDLLFNIWKIQGFAQNVIIGMPEEVAKAQSVAADNGSPAFDGVAALEKLAEKYKSDIQPQDLSDFINWKMLLLWLTKLIIELLTT